MEGSINYDNKHDDFDKKLLYMLSNLNPEEMEIAAKTSYKYMRNPSVSDQKKYAKKMAKRYLESKKDVDLATMKMKETIGFRRKIDMDSIRKAFDDPASHYQTKLEKMLSQKRNYVQGYDKHGRATHIFIPRLTNHHDSEWSLKESLYTMERAIACSRANDSSVNAVIDFSGFQISKHAPPLQIGKDFLLTLRHHYAGQVHKIFILDAPMSFSLFWKLFKPFVGETTQEKIYFLSGRNKKFVLEQYYELDEATPWMLPNGNKNRTFHLEKYLYGTPFDKAFDE